MFRYYLGFPFAKLARRKWLHPVFNTQYNALQRAAYFSVPVAGLLSVATGWAIHKPMQFALAGSVLWRVQRSTCLAFLADVGLHPLRRAACDSGIRRRMGYVAQHDRRLVNKSKTVGVRRK
jgi:hypothetical protein